MPDDPLAPVTRVPSERPVRGVEPAHDRDRSRARQRRRGKKHRDPPKSDEEPGGDDPRGRRVDIRT